MNVLFFVAHPDDGESSCGGFISYLIDHGHKVKIVTATNGDAGCGLIPREEAAAIRAREAKDAATCIGAEMEIMSNHDGYLQPTIENRERLVALLRDWNTDILVTHPHFDYHPDHRATAQIAIDAGFMTVIPAFFPTKPIAALPQPPIILQCGDCDFRNPNLPCDWPLDIAPYMRRKAKAVSLHRNQNRLPEEYDYTDEQLYPLMVERFMTKNHAHANYCREYLKEFFGEERGSKVEYAECYAISPYGRQITRDELKTLLPQ